MDALPQSIMRSARAFLLALPVLAVAIWAPAASAMTFSGVTNYGVGSEPNTVAISNFNGDSNPDIVTVNETSNNVSVLLGSSNGSFSPAPGSPFAVNSLPDAIAISDLNGDAREDLVVANQNSDDISILMGVSNGSFTGPTNLSAVPPPTTINDPAGITNTATAITVADTSAFSASGLIRIDNEVISYTGMTATSFTGCARGVNATTTAAHANGAAVIQVAGDGPTGVAVADFDNDSYPDVVVTNEISNTISVMMGKSPRGTFNSASSIPTGVAPQAVIVANFNGDSNLDLAVVNEAPTSGVGSVAVLFGAGDGTFTQSVSYPYGSRRPASMVLGDFDGDSKSDDFAVANFASNDVSIFLGSSNGTFARPADVPLPGGSSPVSVDTGDFNKDSKPDLAVDNEGTHDVTLLFGAGNGNFGSPLSIVLPTSNLSPQMAAVGDLNGDSFLDLAVADKLFNRASVLFALEPNTTINSGPSSLTNDPTPTFTFSSNDQSSTFQCKVDGGAFTSCTSPHTTATLPDGARTIQVRAIDNGGHIDSSPATWSFTLDTVPPPIPTLTDSDPGSGANDNSPKIRGTAATGATVTIYTTADCSGSPTATGTAAQFNTTGFPVSVPDNSTTDFYATASDPAGNVSGCSTSSVTYVEVSPPPPPPPPDPGPGTPPGGGGPAGPSGPPGTPVVVDVTPPVMTIGGKSLKVSSSGSLSLSLACPASEPGGCSGSVALESSVKVGKAKRKLKLGTGSFKIGGGKNAAVKLRLSKKNRLVVKKLRKIRVQVIVKARDQVGNAKTSVTYLILKA
jgi:hypothetical protein